MYGGYETDSTGLWELDHTLYLSNRDMSEESGHAINLYTGGAIPSYYECKGDYTQQEYLYYVDKIVYEDEYDPKVIDLGIDPPAGYNYDECFSKCLVWYTGEFDLSMFDFSQVKSAESMFANSVRCKFVNGQNCDFGNCLSLKKCFYKGTGNTQDMNLSNWNVEKCENFSYMFSETTNTTWNTYPISEHERLSTDYSLKKIRLVNWKPKAARDMTYMFYGSKHLNYIYLNNWCAPENPVNMNYMFANIYCIRAIYVDKGVDGRGYKHGLMTDNTTSGFDMSRDLEDITGLKNNGENVFYRDCDGRADGPDWCTTYEQYLRYIGPNRTYADHYYVDTEDDGKNFLIGDALNCFETPDDSPDDRPTNHYYWGIDRAHTNNPDFPHPGKEHGLFTGPWKDTEVWYKKDGHWVKVNVNRNVNGEWKKVKPRVKAGLFWS